MENARNLAENLRRLFLFSSLGDRLKKIFEDDFFKENFEDLSLGGTLAPWLLASRGSVLGRAVLGLGFFLFRWSRPRALCPRPHLWFLNDWI